MRRGRAAATALCAAVPLALACGFLPQQEKTAATRTLDETVIVTATPAYDSLAALRGAERFPQGAELMVLRAGRMRALAPEFAASADASVSFDGKTVLFAGKKSTGDRWQIWEMPVAGGAPRLVVRAETDLIHPLPMPEGHVVYARRQPGGFALETATLDGSATLRLSYGPGNYVPDDVLRDGRILFESGYPLGAGQKPEMYLVYADGSGLESVRCDHSAGPMRDGGREHGRQMASGDVVFTHGARLGRFTSALADEAAIEAPAGEYAGDVAEMADGRWLVAARRAGEPHYRLALWRPGAASLTTVAGDAQRDLVEPVVVQGRETPRRHPSALHPWGTGNLLALDARESREGRVAGVPAAVRAETMSVDGKVMELGTAPVEKDGSFFVAAAGDRPLRFVLLDAAGNTLRAEKGWFWVRRGEQRICVGCHTGPERAPANRTPAVLLRTTTPADLTGGGGREVGR